MLGVCRGSLLRGGLPRRARDGVGGHHGGHHADSGHHGDGHHGDGGHGAHSDHEARYVCMYILAYSS